MRIIATNHDYYDCIQPYDTDKSVVWVRSEKEILISRKQITLHIASHWNPDISPLLGFSSFVGNVDMDETVIGFCGKIYIVLILRKMGIESKKYFCYSIEDVDAFIRAEFPNQFDKYAIAFRKGKSVKQFRGWNFSRYKRVEIFNAFEKIRDKHRKLFEEKYCPVFIMEHSEKLDKTKGYNYYLKMTLNATLGQYQFFRVFDAYRAFQEISMFMNSIAIPSKQMPVIPDVINAESHGFDKHSFRRDPAGNKRKARRKGN